MDSRHRYGWPQILEKYKLTGNKDEIINFLRIGNLTQDELNDIADILDGKIKPIDGRIKEAKSAHLKQRYMFYYYLACEVNDEKTDCSWLIKAIADFYKSEVEKPTKNYTHGWIIDIIADEFKYEKTEARRIIDRHIKDDNWPKLPLQRLVRHK